MSRTQTETNDQRIAFFRLGFRPFFAGASVFAVLTVVAWTLVYTLGIPLPITTISPFAWHAHEMIYGYSLAVIAGFLLTAVRNWTGIQTANGWRLALLFGLWAAARISMLAGTFLLYAGALLDVLFVAGLIVSFAHPVLRARKWKQLGILTILILLGAGNACFYLGALGWLSNGIDWGTYSGLYLVVGLILIMGRRVIPMFIQGGVGYAVTPSNRIWVDRATPILFLALGVIDVFSPDKRAVPWLAAALFAINLVRLLGWHTPGVWKKPLLWSLYTAYAFIVLGFGLLASSGFAGTSRFVAIHSLTYGGIGLVTLSMMARVTLGHTGRSVHEPPGLLSHCFLILLMGAFFRVLLPLMDMQHYIIWIALSQLAWILAFSGLTAMLLPMVWAPRVDARAGPVPTASYHQ